MLFPPIRRSVRCPRCGLRYPAGHDNCVHCRHLDEAGIARLQERARRRRRAGARLGRAFLMAATLLATVSAIILLTACSGQRLVNALTPDDGYTRHAGLAYGKGARRQLDVYVPDEPAPGRPVVVFFYGGRWQDGSRAGYRFAAQALTSRGYLAIVPDYRLYPEVRFPAFVADGARAVAWAHGHARGYGGDPEHLFLMGHSAGAHIAAMLAADRRYLGEVGLKPRDLAGVIGLAGPYDFLPLEAADLEDIFGPPERYLASQPIRFVNGDEPPLLLMHGLEDGTVDPGNTRRMARAVRERGGEAETILYPDQDHVGIVAALAAPLRFTGTVLQDAAGFVERRTAPGDGSTAARRD